MIKGIITASLLLLAGCATGPSQNQINMGISNANAAANECLMGLVGQESTVLQVARCQNNGYQAHLMPVYPHKGLLLEFMAEKLELANQVDSGKISIEQAEVLEQKAFAKLLNAEQHANAAIRSQNEQAWQDYSKRLQEYSHQVTQAEIERQNANQAQPALQSNQNMRCTTNYGITKCSAW